MKIRLALVYRGVGLLLATLALISNMIVPNLKFILSRFMYYTIQSNILAFVLFALLFFRSVYEFGKKERVGRTDFFTGFQFICVINLLLTFCVYWMILLPDKFTMGYGSVTLSFRNLSVHLIVPLLCLIDYFAFSNPGKLKYRSIWGALIYPTFYIILVAIMARSGFVFRLSKKDGQPVRYPYSFLDFDRYGKSVFLSIAILALLILIFAHILYGIDYRRTKRTNHTKQTN